MGATRRGVIKDLSGGMHTLVGEAPHTRRHSTRPDVGATRAVCAFRSWPRWGETSASHTDLSCGIYSDWVGSLTCDAVLTLPCASTLCVRSSEE